VYSDEWGMRMLWFAWHQGSFYNPSYWGGWDQEDHGSRPIPVNSAQDPISKITRAEWTGGVAQATEFLRSKHWVKTPVWKEGRKGQTEDGGEKQRGLSWSKVHFLSFGIQFYAS
jgi:hypothetical protein